LIGPGQALAEVERVIECFPEHAASIRERFQQDQGFREMCGDYVETLQALQRWQMSEDPRKAARIDEYQELARALESEIATALRLPSRELKDQPS
jgi:hypothetical protein